MNRITVKAKFERIEETVTVTNSLRRMEEMLSGRINLGRDLTKEVWSLNKAIEIINRESNEFVYGDLPKEDA